MIQHCMLLSYLCVCTQDTKVKLPFAEHIITLGEDMFYTVFAY